MDTGEEEEKDYTQKDVATPIGLALTEFHCVLLFREKYVCVCVCLLLSLCLHMLFFPRMVGICHLNNKKVFEEFFNVRVSQVHMYNYMYSCICYCHLQMTRLILTSSLHVLCTKYGWRQSTQHTVLGVPQI